MHQGYNSISECLGYCVHLGGVFHSLALTVLDHKARCSGVSILPILALFFCIVLHVTVTINVDIMNMIKEDLESNQI